MPYDLSVPANWTVVKLKTEISKFGVTLSASSIPKSALLQIHQQLETVQNRHGGNQLNQPTSGSTTSQMDNTSQNATLNIEPDNSVSDLPSPETSISIPATSQIGSSHELSQSKLLDSTISMVSSMQGAISSLQSSINNLVNKQSSSATTNRLEQYFSAQTDQGSGSTMLQTTCSSKSYGIPADNLPYVDVVPDSVKKNIIAGKYVNLASLLIPDYDSSLVDNMGGLDQPRRQQRDNRLDRVLSITQFYKAFGIYKRVMCEAYPQRRDELDLYEADIGRIFEHYGSVFYQYHVTFSKQAAAYLEKGFKVDWSKRHKDLFQLLIGGTQTKLCDYCSQADHESSFCPTQINVSRPIRFKTNSNYSSVDPRNDILGRSRVMFKGKEICNNFNGERGCIRPYCAFLHVCKRCRGSSHGESSCHPNTLTVPDNSTSARDKSKSKNPV